MTQKLTIIRDYGEPKKLPVNQKTDDERIDEYFKKLGIRPHQRAKMINHWVRIEAARRNLGIK